MTRRERAIQYAVWVGLYVAVCAVEGLFVWGLARLLDRAGKVG